MGESNPQSRWIVIINKAPKGPFSAAEVKALVDKGMLRLNDLAVQVVPKTESGKSDWKFLWQFAEFNRRKGREGDKPATAPVKPLEPTAEEKAREERRRRMSEEEAKRKAIENLPEDLASINPEDLVSRPSGNLTRDVESPAADASPLSALPDALPASSRNWILSGVAVGAAAFSVFFWLGSRPPEATTKNRQLPAVVQRPAPNVAEPDSGPRRSVSSRSASSSPAGGMPSARIPNPSDYRPPPRREEPEVESRYDTPEVEVSREAAENRDRGEVPNPEEAMEGPEEEMAENSGPRVKRGGGKPTVRRGAAAEDDAPPQEYEPSEPVVTPGDEDPGGYED